ncbi:MAG: hypothetical protein ACYC1C_10980 [Chloroflexota bacterium]
MPFVVYCKRVGASYVEEVGRYSSITEAEMARGEREAGENDALRCWLVRTVRP